MGGGWVLPACVPAGGFRPISDWVTPTHPALLQRPSCLCCCRLPATLSRTHPPPLLWATSMQRGAATWPRWVRHRRGPSAGCLLRAWWMLHACRSLLPLSLLLAPLACLLIPLFTLPSISLPHTAPRAAGTGRAVQQRIIHPYSLLRLRPPVWLCIRQRWLPGGCVLHHPGPAGCLPGPRLPAVWWVLGMGA